MASLEADNQTLRDRLLEQEKQDSESAKIIAKLRTDNVALATQHEQQRILFDRSLDEIANHVVQALISQKVFQWRSKLSKE